MRTLMLGLLILLPSLMAQQGSKPEDRFADEPERPKADTPIRFSGSWDEARAEAERTGRRILAYFTSDYCGWCRVMEKRTFTDAEVVALSKHFVCVGLDTEEHPRLADEFRVDTIPRSYVMTAEGEVVDRRTGYIPATEYAAWLEAARTKPPAISEAVGPAPEAPPPVGAPESEADVVIWFVDGGESIERWVDGDWTSHSHLLRLLRAAGLRTRIEHIAREDFPARWDDADEVGRAPELITSARMAGLIGELIEGGQLFHVHSERLMWSPEVASCPDFAGRGLFLVAGSRDRTAGRRAAAALLEPAPATPLPGPDLPMTADRDEAIRVARRATVAYLSGDREALEQVSSKASPQLSRCTEPEDLRRGLEVETGSVEIRGNDRLAFARIETEFSGETLIGADPVLVVLRREGPHWKAFTVSANCLVLRELYALCRLDLGAQVGPEPPAVPRLLDPANGGAIGEGGRSFAWEVPDGGEPLAAQVCQVLLDSGEAHNWPEIVLKVFPGEPRGQALQSAETATSLTGVSAEEMSWCVWSIASDGQLAVSEARSYRFLNFSD